MEFLHLWIYLQQRPYHLISFFRTKSKKPVRATSNVYIISTAPVPETKGERITGTCWRPNEEYTIFSCNRQFSVRYFLWWFSPFQPYTIRVNRICPTFLKHFPGFVTRYDVEVRPVEYATVERGQLHHSSVLSRHPFCTWLRVSPNASTSPCVPRYCWRHLRGWVVQVLRVCWMPMGLWRSTELLGSLFRDRGRWQGRELRWLGSTILRSSLAQAMHWRGKLVWRRLAAPGAASSSVPCTCWEQIPSYIRRLASSQMQNLDLILSMKAKTILQIFLQQFLKLKF